MEIDNYQNEAVVWKWTNSAEFFSDWYKLFGFFFMNGGHLC